MTFKLGSRLGSFATNGVIKNKLSFKNDEASVTGTPIIRKDLDEGVLGEANMDGSIYISNMVEPGSHEETQTLIHEMRHATDIKIGKLEYSDDHVMYNGEYHPRETRNGKDMIKIEGKWKAAGDGTFPWEIEANMSAE